MNLYLTDEQNMLQESVARLFAAESSGERVRAVEGTGFDPALWRQLQDMGLNLMRLPEEVGGLGSSLLDAVLVAEQAGRHLVSVPLIEHMAASRLLAQFGGDLVSAALTKLAEGALITLLPQPFISRQMPINGAAVADYVVLADDNAVYLLSKEQFSPIANLGSGALAVLNDTVHLSDYTVAEGVEDRQGNRPGAGQLKGNDRGRIEGVGIVGLETEVS